MQQETLPTRTTLPKLRQSSTTGDGKPKETLNISTCEFQKASDSYMEQQAPLLFCSRVPPVAVGSRRYKLPWTSMRRNKSAKLEIGLATISPIQTLILAAVVAPKYTPHLSLQLLTAANHCKPQTSQAACPKGPCTRMVYTIDPKRPKYLNKNYTNANE